MKETTKINRTKSNKSAMSIKRVDTISKRLDNVE